VNRRKSRSPVTSSVTPRSRQSAADMIARQRESRADRC
jgi:hypothetical protein